ncbi:MAG: serine hydrolase [Planctomycetota bacterium]
MSSCSIPYTWRVLTDQAPDYDDIERDASSVIQPAAEPRALTLERDGRVAQAVGEWFASDLDRGLGQSDTRAFLVARGGVLVEEWYADGFDGGTPLNTFSVSKSVTSLLVGLVIEDGAIDLESSVGAVVPALEARDPRFAEVTVRDLLGMRSGVRFSKEVSFPWVDADPSRIAYSSDLESVLLECIQIDSAPGTFRYNDYDAMLLGLVLRRSTGSSPSELLETRLWGPIGASRPAGWLTDRRGFERMESGFHATGRDLIRLGQLLLDQGSVDGRSILSPAWIERSTQAEPAGAARQFGLGWWVLPAETGPADFCAIGHLGQYLYLSPRHAVAIVRSGPGDGGRGHDAWLELLGEIARELSPDES